MSALVKFLIAFSIFYTCDATFSQEQIRSLGTHCKANDDDLQVAMKYEVPTTPTGKCLMKCMVDKLGMLTSDGGYNKTGTVIALSKYWVEWPEDKRNTIANSCEEHIKQDSGAQSDTTGCYVGYLTIKCIREKSEEYKLLTKSLQSP